MEAFHYYGSDLSISASGDLLLADGLELSKQAVLRRLLTNAALTDASGKITQVGDYIWQLDYGAGLPQKVGTLLDLPAITALIRAQMYLEQSVSQNPEPAIAVQPIPGGVAAQITYTTADGLQAFLSFSTDNS